VRTAKLGTQIRQVSAITVLIGFVSYAFNFVTARVLAPDNAARVMTLWTVINLCLLVVQFPIEPYGPRLLRSLAEREKQRYFDSVVLVYIAASSIATFLLFCVYYIFRYQIDYSEVGVFALLIASSSLFQMFRTINIARENLTSLVKSAAFLSVGSFFSFLLVFLLDIDSTVGPLLAAAFGFTLANFISKGFTDATRTRVNSIFRERKSYLQVFSFQEIGALSLSNMVSLLLVPGGTLFTGIVGLDTEETVVYLGSIALALIPMTILNSTTTPVYLRAISLFSEKKMTQLRVLLFKSALVYISISIILVSSFWLVGEKLLLSFLGAQYQYSQSIFVFSSITVCASFIGSIPRLFLMAMGKTKETYKPLLMTVVLYLTLVLSIRNGTLGIFVASISSSLFISLTTLIILYQNSRQISERTSSTSATH
jgi:O-antigen/teichoic acid export membrane protein